MTRDTFGRLTLALAVIFGCGTARAAQLDPKICTDLKVEQTLLQSKGLAVDLAKGAEWGKANLSRERLAEIERLIHVEEQLAFRCPQPKRPPSAGEEDEDGTPAKAKAPGKGQVARAAKPAAKAAAAPEGEEAKPKPAPKKSAPAKAAQAAEPAAAESQPPRKTPARPKPKTEDAYSPAAGGKPAPDTPVFTTK